MGQIASPYEGKKFKKVEGGKGYHYDTSHFEEVVTYKPINPRHPERGVYPVADTVEIPDNPEVIDLKTGQSNSKYWQPESVSNPEGCPHSFKIENIGRREIICSNSKCNLGFTFHPTDLIEKDGKTFINFRKKTYEIQ